MLSCFWIKFKMIQCRRGTREKVMQLDTSNTKKIPAILEKF